MESTIEQRYAIKFCFRLGKNTSETFAMLQEAFKDECLSYSQVKKWYKAFKEGREAVADEPRSGRPVTSRIYENVQRVRDFLNCDRRLSVCQVAKALNIPKSTVHRIISEDLSKRKVCTKGVRQGNKKVERGMPLRQGMVYTIDCI
ncbi:protein GVQW3-like [Anopheles marshallii]|uniref:protein GVQW3-like n=1 Tax=Anopheles marshallii TaxID=1521116 RepID=UPI00237A5FEC|nr:protein GVQW3-like [Anopheles marshallii]